MKLLDESHFLFLVFSFAFFSCCYGWGPIAHRTQMHLLAERAGNEEVTQTDLAAATAPDALRSVVPQVHDIAFVTCAALLAKARNRSHDLNVLVRMGMHLNQDRIGHATAVPHRLPLHIDEFAAETEHLWRQSGSIPVHDKEAFTRVAETVHEYTREALCSGNDGGGRDVLVDAKRLRRKLCSFEALVRLDVFFAFFNTPFWRLEYFGASCSVHPSRLCSMEAAERWREAVLAARGYGEENVTEAAKRIVEETSGSIGAECLCKEAASFNTQRKLFSCTVSGVVSLAVLYIVITKYKRHQRARRNESPEINQNHSE